MEFKTSSLDTTMTGGGKRREAEYASLQRQALPLRAKYRMGGRVYSKGGNNSSGRSGVAKHKVPVKNQAPARQMVLSVDGRTGKSKFIPLEG